MAQFRDEALKLVSGYKKIIKRQLPQAEANKKFKTLNIKSRQLAIASDIQLYKTVALILENISEDIEKNRQTTYEYSGIVEFNDELKILLNTYQINGDTVKNKVFAGSRALLNAIQLIAVPINDQNRKKLEQNLDCLENCGTQEQIAKMIHLLQKQASNDKNTYQPYVESLLKRYQNKNQNLGN